jgi:hypothetical protein
MKYAEETVMSETVYNLDRDLAEARAMAQSLEDYLRDNVLYGSVNGLFSSDPDMPSLTIGALLLRLRRLAAQERRMSPEQKAILSEIEMLHDDVRGRMTGRYHERLVNEAGARLRTLEAFLAECEGGDQECADSYLPEALRRTIVQEIVAGLQKYGMPLIDLDTTVRRNDQIMRRFVKPSDFIWADALQPFYPSDTYWWLYARPAVESREEEFS